MRTNTYQSGQAQAQAQEEGSSKDPRTPLRLSQNILVVRSAIIGTQGVSVCVSTSATACGEVLQNTQVLRLTERPTNLQR